jgi:outer membrane immunogenic protein
LLNGNETEKVMYSNILIHKQNMLRVGGAVAVFALIFVNTYSGAIAADAIDEQPPAPPPAPVQEISDAALWTGPYVGAYGKYNWLDLSVDGAGSEKTHGWGGGGYLGYNYQLPNNVVLGIEATGGLTDTDETVSGVNVRQDWEASLRGRMGYAFENSMIYGLAGLGASKVEASVPGTDDRNIHLGWNIGAGVETHLTENITGRLEYDYTDYQSQDYSLGGGDTSVDLNSHAIKLGVGFRF